MSKPTFSVIITTYNYGHFLAECIDSVLAQTVPREEVEIIVVDDGSADATAQVVAPYAAKGLIRYIVKSNGGHASALNVGFLNSHGDILAFLDADDVWFPDKLRVVQDVYSTFHCDAVFHNVGRFSRHNEELQMYRTEPTLFRWMVRISPTLFRSHVTVYGKETDFLAILSAQTYSRKLCERLFPIPEVFIRHTDAYLHYLCYVFSDIYFDTRMLTKYRNHPHSHMFSLHEKKEQGYLDLEMRLEGIMIRELRKRAFPNIPPGLGGVRNAWILHRAESLVRLGKKAESVRLLLRSFLAKELEIGRHELIKKIFWACVSWKVFSFVRRCYRKIGLVRLRWRWVNYCQARRHAAQARALAAFPRARQLSP